MDQESNLAGALPNDFPAQDLTTVLNFLLRRNTDVRAFASSLAELAEYGLGMILDAVYPVVAAAPAGISEDDAGQLAGWLAQAEDESTLPTVPKLFALRLRRDRDRSRAARVAERLRKAGPLPDAAKERERLDLLAKFESADKSAESGGVNALDWKAILKQLITFLLSIFIV